MANPDRLGLPARMDLDPLRIAAALVSPYPTWRVEAPDEPTLLLRLAAAGEVPQADLFEPWEEADPWLARVLWPPLADPDPLLEHGELEDGMAPGMAEWMDRGRLGQDALISGQVRAVCLSDLEQGGLLIPDLIHHETEAPELVSIGLALLASVGARGEEDSVSLVQHRTTGRLGLLLEVRVPDTDPQLERQAVLDGVASVVVAEASVRLSPDLRWWYDQGKVSILAWLVAPIHPVLPDDRFTEARPDLSGRSSVELQVLLGEEQALVLGEQLGSAGMVGSRSRWVSWRGRRVFASCWTGPSRPSVEIDAPHRWVVGCPTGLEGDWLGIDPAYWISGSRVICRWHCGLRDRDLLPLIEPREADAVDTELAAKLSLLGQIEPVMAGRPALQLSLPALDAEAWTGLVDALGALPDRRLDPVLYVAMRQRFTVLLFRADLPVPDAEPAWEARR